MVPYMKKFPVDKLVPKAPGIIEGRIEFNPFSRIPPSLWYGVGVEFEELPELGSLLLSLDGIELPEKDWRSFGGPYIAPKPWDNGSILVDSAHNPADTYSIHFTNRRGPTFEVTVDVAIDFAFEGVDYENVRIPLSFMANFHGVVFHEPNWSDPSKVKFPTDWRIPSEYTPETVDELVSRFADLGGYDKLRESSHWKYLPGNF
jgi:hypothetical protein